MFQTKRVTFFVFMIAAMSLLGACTIGQAPAATPTALDVNAIYTSAAETARAQMTDIASLATATLPPTATTAPTEISTQAPLVQVTISVETTPLNTPDPLVIGASPTLAGLLATITPIPTLGAASGTSTGPICSNYVFEGDITIPDGTQFKAWEKFTKIWALRNTGVCTWDEGYSFRNFAGASLNGDTYTIQSSDQFVAPGEGINIGIKMYAPGEPGQYVSHWTMFDDKNQSFGFGVTVVIEVVK